MQAFNQAQAVTIYKGWDMWCELLNQYFEVNQVSEGKRISLFLTLIVQEAYVLLRDLCTPELPQTKTLDALKKVMKDHLKPKPSIITEYKSQNINSKSATNNSNIS